MTNGDTSSALIDNLFRREAGRMVALLTKIFGAHNLELAEDVVQDTLLKALEHWKLQGVPENPSAWMLTVARNKALDVLRRERHRKKFANDFTVLLSSEYSASTTVQQIFQDHHIADEQLRMMFVCCEPGIPEEAQVALILKTLCGFSIGEIAKAFLTNEENIAKRLYRARQYLREHPVKFEIPSAAELQARLDNVHVAIYLLFNEGYHATQQDLLIRDDLVEEALRLGNLLLQHKTTQRPETYALVALMCFQSARLYARMDDEGNLLLLKFQKREQWNAELITQGKFFLNKAATGQVMSRYHIEAAIAYEHCKASTYADTNWENILKYYDLLLMVRPDGVVRLNRLIAYSELQGAAAALPFAHELLNDPNLKEYYLLYAAVGEWNAKVEDKTLAAKYFQTAIDLAKTAPMKKFLQQRMEKLTSTYKY